MTAAHITEPVEQTLEAREFLKTLEMVEQQGVASLKKLLDYLTAKAIRLDIEVRSAGKVERDRITLESAWELEAIGHAILKESRSMSAENLLIRCMGLRTIELASIAMDALTDDAEPTDELRDRLFGRTIKGPLETS